MTFPSAEAFLAFAKAAGGVIGAARHAAATYVGSGPRPAISTSVTMP